MNPGQRHPFAVAVEVACILAGTALIGSTVFGPYFASRGVEIGLALVLFIAGLGVSHHSAWRAEQSLLLMRTLLAGSRSGPALVAQFEGNTFLFYSLVHRLMEQGFVTRRPDVRGRDPREFRYSITQAGVQSLGHHFRVEDVRGRLSE